jgi:hypothetical protein
MSSGEVDATSPRKTRPRTSSGIVQSTGKDKQDRSTLKSGLTEIDPDPGRCGDRFSAA